MSESLEAAIRKYSEQLAAEPKSRAFVPLSDAYRKLGRYEEAIAVAQEGVGQHPHYIGGKMALARAHFENGDLDPAQELLDAIVPLSPDNLLANRLLSEIFVQKGETHRAIPLLKQLLKMEPSDARAAQQLAALETTSQEPTPSSKAMEAVQTPAPSKTPAVEAETPPQEGPAPKPQGGESGAEDAKGATTKTVTLAELYRSQGHLDQAMSVYRDLAAAEPGNPMFPQRISEIEAQRAQRKSDPGSRRRIERLEHLLKRVCERRRNELPR